MSSAVRLFLDTSYVIALLNPKDQYHDSAKALYDYVQYATEVWTTEAVLVEIGDSLSRSLRLKAAQFIHYCYRTPNIRVINVSTDIIENALIRYLVHEDKTWGMTDCISFVVMETNSLSEALTADRHFEQAGFRALLRE